jgi:hypothetical protein
MKYFTAMNKSRTKKSEEGQKIRGRRHKHVTPELGKQKGTDHLKDLETDGSVLSKCIVSDCEDSLRQLSLVNTAVKLRVLQKEGNFVTR